MATEIRVPTLGESVTEATIGKWFKKVGDAVAVDEPLVELETDKVTVEVPAAAAGVLAEITAKEGDTVEVNALLGQISGDGSAVAAAPAAKKEEAKPAAAAPAAAPVASASSGPAMQPAPAASSCSLKTTSPPIRSKVPASAARFSRATFLMQSPRAYRLLRHRSLSLLHVRHRRLGTHRVKNA